MHYSRNIWLSVILIWVLTSCFKRVTCPAYQSQYYLNQEEFKKRFSLFESDSIPKPDLGYVKKNKYGIIDEKPYNKKYREMQNIDMVTIYPDYQDSILLVSNVSDSAAAGPAGSRRSPYHTLFNYDQLIYNTLFGRPERSRSTSEEEIREDLEVEEGGEGEAAEEERPGFFQRLFGTKKNRRADEQEPVREEEGTGQDDAIPDPQQDDDPPDEEDVEEDDGF